jgi:hypothetical protein
MTTPPNTPTKPPRLSNALHRADRCAQPYSRRCEGCERGGLDDETKEGAVMGRMIIWLVLVVVAVVVFG